MQYALEGAIGVGGSGISWLRDSLGVLPSAAESEGLAASVPSTEGGLDLKRLRVLCNDPVHTVLQCLRVLWNGLVHAFPELPGGPLERHGPVDETIGSGWVPC